MSDTFNPYAAPEKDHQPVPEAHGDADRAALEAIRNEHLKAETNVKTIGFLLYLGAFFSGIGALRKLGAAPLEGGLQIAFAALVGYAGYLIRRYRRGGRIIYSIFTAFVVVSWFVLWGSVYNLGVAVGQLIWPVIMVAVLWTPKASTVMTPHYRDVVLPGTPHIKYKTSRVVMVLGIILLVLFVIGVLAAIGDM